MRFNHNFPANCKINRKPGDWKLCDSDLSGILIWFSSLLIRCSFQAPFHVSLKMHTSLHDTLSNGMNCREFPFDVLFRAFINCSSACFWTSRELQSQDGNFTHFVHISCMRQLKNNKKLRSKTKFQKFWIIVCWNRGQIHEPLQQWNY